MLGNAAMAYEEAPFFLLKKTSDYEIRKYDTRIAVETAAIGSNSSFQKLFRYISGNNERSETIKMTVPVMQSEIDSVRKMLFFLPSSFRKATAPLPIEKDVKLVTIPPGYYAVMRYSGFASDTNFNIHVAKLKAELIKDNIKIHLPAIKATYNGPLTPFFIRRNEVMFKVSVDQ